MGQVNILKIKRLTTTVSWHAAFFSIPFHFSVFILTFSSWNTFAAHEECGITLRVQLKYEVRYQFSSWDLKGPKAHTIHASKLSKRFSSKLLGWLRRTSRATAWHDLEVVEQGGQDCRCFPRLPFGEKPSDFALATPRIKHRQCIEGKQVPSHHDFMMHAPIQA